MSKNTPYDAIWTALTLATVTYAVGAFLYLRTGGLTLFPNADTKIDPGAAVSVGYWGAALCALMLACLGLLAFRYAGSAYAESGPPWPRLTKIENELRDPFIARTGFAGTLLVCVVTIYSSLYTYFSRSEVSLWDSKLPLADGFLGSRLAALAHDCSQTPCYRMHPVNDQHSSAHQWFWFTDILLIFVLLLSAFIWGLYLNRVCRR